MLEAAANNPRLRAVVSEGAGERSLRETLLHGPAAALVIPQHALLTGAVALLSGDAPPPALDDVSEEIAPRAVFFIHAENGHGGEELNPTYFGAAGERKGSGKSPRRPTPAGSTLSPRSTARES